MLGHKQAFHQFTLDHVSFHDFRDVGFIADPIPDAFRINDDARTIFAMIQTPCLIGTDNAFEPKTLNFLFEKSVKFHGPVVSTAPSWVALGSLINANKNMMLESTHERPLMPALRHRAQGRILQRVLAPVQYLKRSTAFGTRVDGEGKMVTERRPRIPLFCRCAISWRFLDSGLSKSRIRCGSDNYGNVVATRRKERQPFYIIAKCYIIPLVIRDPLISCDSGMQGKASRSEPRSVSERGEG